MLGVVLTSIQRTILPLDRPIRCKA